MEKYKVFLGSDIAKTYSDAKKFTLERVNSFSDNSYLVLFQRIKLIDEFRGDVFFSIGLLLKTLFTPFRLIDANPNYGDSLDAKMRAGIDKLTACLIGGMIRSTMILVGLLAIFVTSIINLMRLIIWLFMPILPVIGTILFALESK